MTTDIPRLRIAARRIGDVATRAAQRKDKDTYDICMAILDLIDPAKGDIEPMVEIIDEGPHESVRKQVVCKNCGATLSYVPADVQERKTTDYTGSTDTYRCIDCPKCKAEVGVKL